MTHNMHAKESGNVVIIVLVALIVVAVGAMAYFSGNLAKEDRAEATMEKSVETASGETDAMDEGTRARRLKDLANDYFFLKSIALNK